MKRGFNASFFVALFNLWKIFSIFLQKYKTKPKPNCSYKTEHKKQKRGKRMKRLRIKSKFEESG